MSINQILPLPQVLWLLASWLPRYPLIFLGSSKKGANQHRQIRIRIPVHVASLLHFDYTLPILTTFTLARCWRIVIVWKKRRRRFWLWQRHRFRTRPFNACCPNIPWIAALKIRTCEWRWCCAHQVSCLLRQARSTHATKASAIWEKRPSWRNINFMSNSEVGNYLVFIIRRSV